MKFQGLVLAIIILVSIFITSPHNNSLTQKRIQTSQSLVTTVKSQEAKIANYTETALAVNSVSISNASSLSTVKTENKKQTISTNLIFLKRLLNTNIDLSAQKTENRWPIASLTKLMTALIVTENINRNTEITLSETAIVAEGGIGDLEAGEIYKASDLLKAMLVLSSNDSAEALAEYGEQDFVALMNQKAVELDMIETKYVDPTGISFLNQSTANDLSKLVNYIYFYHPEIFTITQARTVSFSEIQSGQTKTFNTINEFAGQPNFLGGKTGFIHESKGNLISLFQDSNGRGPILIIVLGSDDRFNDTRILLKELQ